MGITCCKDCSERHPGCHDKCERYIKQKADLQERKKWMIKTNKACILSNWDFDKVTLINADRSKHRAGQ